MENVVTMEVYGGQGGDAWDDKIYTTVRQLIIHSGTVIDSIQVEYDENGESKWSEKHGGEGGDKHIVQLGCYPAEFLVSISGYYSKRRNNTVVVHSLILQSNKKQYGPFGSQEGEYFSSPPGNGKIIGFHGRSGRYLDSIGAYIRAYPQQEWDDGVHTRLRLLIICADLVVESIKIEYDDDGESKWSEKHGESEGGTQHIVKLDCPNEYLISVSGHLKEETTPNAGVKSLTIQSNRNKYGPFGVEEGNYFFTSTNGRGQIVGLFGKSGLFVDSIGAHLGPIKVGPVGSRGGTRWDDGIHSGVKQIIVHSGEIVDSIQFEYDNNGTSRLSEKHCESRGGTTNIVQLDYPNEYLVSVSGHYGESYNGWILVRSLKFESNKATYGPFGDQVGNPFELPSNGGKIVGFHGRSGQFLDSIGLNVY